SDKWQTWLRNPKTGKNIGPIDDLHAMGFSPDGKIWAISGLDNEVHMFDRNTGKEVRKFNLGETLATSLFFSPDSKWLAGVLSWDIVFWDTGTGRELGGYRIHENAINQPDFLPNGRAVITSSGDYSIRIWDRHLKDEVRRIELPDGGQNLRFAISPDSHAVAIFGGDNDIRLWEVATGKIIAHFRGHR